MKSTNGSKSGRPRGWLTAGAVLVFGGLLPACREPAPTHDTAASAAPSSAAPSSSARPGTAFDALDGMDVRKPVPLLPMMANHQKQNMRDHLVAVQEIIVAAASNDFAGVERAASRIGSSEQMGRMCSHMGAAAPGFTDQALAFHRTADTVAEAARKGDKDAVMSALGRTLATCTGCHAAWKQQVVDESTWQRLTSSAPPTGHR
ncbi:cytochrome c [Polyangium spumosum]|nr:cytochrome c [Polyangium spumosum]